MKNYLAPVLVVLVVIVGVVYATRPVPVSAPTSGLVASSTPVASATSSAAVKPTQPPSSTSNVAANATIKVNDTAYLVDIALGETGIEAMQSLVAAGTLQFTGRDYPGLGFFVDSIGGVVNGGGMYWVFYINGKSATTGISSVVLVPGDTLEWKYEKGY